MLSKFKSFIGAGIDANLLRISGSWGSEITVPGDWEVKRTIQKHFDSTFYLSSYSDIAAVSNVDPLHHYIRHGWKEGRNPSRSFSTSFYLRMNPDVAKSGLNPLWHYITRGKREGRSPLPEAGAGSHNSVGIQSQEIETIRPAFDVNFYLSTYPDVAASPQIDPLEHYCRHGWKEGRDPSPNFSTSYYLKSNPDVEEARINPLWHFVVAGRSEGRKPKHPGGYKVEALSRTVSLEEQVREWRTAMPPSETLSTQQIINYLKDRSEDKNPHLIISIGHDNYRKESGGVQLCIFREEERARDRGIVYLNIHPHQPLPRLAHTEEDADVLVCLMLSGDPIGVTHMSELVKAVREISRDTFKIDVIIHHLLGHSAEQIEALIRAAGQSKFWFWVHDFFSICPSPGLQRNSISPCNAPISNSNACALCIYGSERINQYKRLSKLFDSLSSQVIAPSEFAARFWSDKSGLRSNSLVVAEHITLERKPRDSKIEPSKGPIRVAFLGYPSSYKGWPTFQRLVRSFGPSARFEFYYLGKSPTLDRQVKCVNVHVTPENKDAMINALGENEIDLVLHWATCGETFSISTHEAVVAGAFVITNPISGNVAEVVKRTNSGIILSDEDELEEYFASERVDQLAAKSRQRRAAVQLSMQLSQLTLPFLEAKEQK